MSMCCSTITNFRPIRRAASAVVPDPPNGSKTLSPGSDATSKILSSNPRGLAYGNGSLLLRCCSFRASSFVGTRSSRRQDQTLETTFGRPPGAIKEGRNGNRGIRKTAPSATIPRMVALLYLLGRLRRSGVAFIPPTTATSSRSLAVMPGEEWSPVGYTPSGQVNSTDPEGKTKSVRAFPRCATGTLLPCSVKPSVKGRSFSRSFA